MFKSFGSRPLISSGIFVASLKNNSVCSLKPTFCRYFTVSVQDCSLTVLVTTLLFVAFLLAVISFDFPT